MDRQLFRITTPAKIAGAVGANPIQISANWIFWNLHRILHQPTLKTPKVGCKNQPMEFFQSNRLTEWWRMIDIQVFAYESKSLKKKFNIPCCTERSLLSLDVQYSTPSQSNQRNSITQLRMGNFHLWAISGPRAIYI